MTEPNDDARRVPHVDITISGAVPAIQHQPHHERAIVAVDTVQRFVSFDDFYRAHRQPIARALSLTLRDPQLAAEATDEAMARAYQRWHHVNQLDNPGGWVYRVALNWSRSFLRRVARPAPIWVAPESHAAPPAIHDPAIDRALDQLSIDQRAVVVCRLLLGWSELHTAATLGIKPGTVKSRLHRAVHRLSSLLAPLEEHL